MPRYIYLRDEISWHTFGHPEEWFFDRYIKDQPLAVLRFVKINRVYHVQDPTDPEGYFVVPDFWVNETKATKKSA